MHLDKFLLTLPKTVYNVFSSFVPSRPGSRFSYSLPDVNHFDQWLLLQYLAYTLKNPTLSQCRSPDCSASYPRWSPYRYNLVHDTNLSHQEELRRPVRCHEAQHLTYERSSMHRNTNSSNTHRADRLGLALQYSQVPLTLLLLRQNHRTLQCVFLAVDLPLKALHRRQAQSQELSAHDRHPGA